MSWVPPVALRTRSGCDLPEVLDIVHVEGLEVTCIVGVNTNERVREQRIAVHMSLSVDTRLCGRTDDLNYTVNYQALSKRVESVCAEAKCFTLESLCTVVARECLFGPASGAGAVKAVRVRIEKPEALKRAKWPAVEVHRTRAYYELEDAHWGPPRPPALVYKSASESEISASASRSLSGATVYLVLGSNLGARSAHLRAALRLLNGGALDAALAPGDFLRVVDTSWLYETAPAYVTDQRAFLNAAVRVQTSLEPHALLAHIKAIEAFLGRPAAYDPRYVRHGARAIDIDIALWGGGRVVDEGEFLTIPHARLAERDFALAPLADIARDVVHPLLHASVAQLLTRLGSCGGVSGGAIRRVFCAPRGGGAVLMTYDSGKEEECEGLLPLGERTLIVGILNTTPDSFSDGGDLERVGGGMGGAATAAAGAAETAVKMVAAGADVLDVGGQSTRPGAIPISESEEIARVVPAIKAIRSALGPRIVISVDTFSAAVARAAVGAGATMVNDVSGGADAAMLSTVAELGVPYVLMHTRGTPATMDSLAVYAGESGSGSGRGSDAAEAAAVVADVRMALVSGAAQAIAAGIPRWDLLLDPGLGFAKAPVHNFALLRGGRGEGGGATASYPSFYGPSLKSFLTAAIGARQPKDRAWATAAAVTAAVAAGADFVRVHDVAAMSDTCKTADAIFR